jgi:hypothetical protein
MRGHVSSGEYVGGLTSTPGLEGRGVAVKILCIMAYANGYRGLLEETDAYFFFQLPRNGRLTRLVRYDKAQFPSRRGFVGGMTKFIPRHFFLDQPIPVESTSFQAMDSLFRRLGREVH